MPGGRGWTWATSAVVLKPIDDEAEATWIAALLSEIPERGFRVARPIRATDGRWVVDGWSAWTRLAGTQSTSRWPELIAAADGFHAAISRVSKPEFIERRDDRWRRADRVAWAEVPWAEFRTTTHVEPLVAARRPVDLPAQLIHGDLAGNVLFAPAVAPAIIDLSLYWRPVGYAAAIVVADAIAWEGAPPSTLGLLEHLSGWPQLFLRAVLFRIVVNEIARRTMPGRADLSSDYRPVVDLAISRALSLRRPHRGLLGVRASAERGRWP